MDYHRNLPHFYPKGAAIFITFRLYGTLPMSSQRTGEAFAAADIELEKTTIGPDWLRHPTIAECVTRVIAEGSSLRGIYALIAFAVMPNHVHLLIEPDAPIAKITQYIKGVSAKKANELLKRTGHRFWQGESYDHWVRSQKERTNIVRYIEFNPVRANLAAEPAEFRYSSAFGT